MAEQSDASPDGQPAGQPGGSSAAKTPEELKDQGNLAFKKAQVLRRTTAGKQYLAEAKASYAEALSKLGDVAADEHSLALVCTLHANLAAVYLQEVPPKWQEAKAAAEIALAVEPKHVKALYRRAQAWLEDGREGLPEASLRAALADLDAARAGEPGNAQVNQEAERIRRRLAAIKAARQLPPPVEIVGRLPRPLLDRGGDCLITHGYIWGQTETIVHVFVPARGTRLAKSSDVSVEVKSRSLRLVLPHPNGEPARELTGRLHKVVQPDDCSWQLEDGGLVLHVELAKQLVGNEAGGDGEHWRCVWEGHPQTRAPTAAERRELEQMAAAACRVEAEEEQPKQDPRAAEALQRMREMCPGVNIEWGDTSLDAFR